MLRLGLALVVCFAAVSSKKAINGTRCLKNQVISRLTVYEDGTLEAECAAIPCGEVGRRCIEDQTSCRADTDVFSGMRWAPNGQSVLLRCCTIKLPNKIYVGTDLVTAGSYYEGGPIAKKDMYFPKGKEFDFIANVRTEQGGVRVWVYRVACGDDDRRVDFEPVSESPAVPSRPAVTQPEVRSEPKQSTQSESRVREELKRRVQSETEENEGDEEEEEEEEGEEEEEEEATKAPSKFNPLRYRPPNMQRSSTGVKRV